MSKKDFTWKDAVPSVFAFFLFIMQIIYGIFFSKNPTITIISYIGIGIFILSGIFGMTPVIVFPKKGGAGKGKNFVYTKKIVTTGIYSIVRHPQYSSFILWAFGSIFLFQNLVIIILGIPIILLTYYDMTREDKRNIKKFGKSYEEYMKKVPRANFLLGIILVIYRKYSKENKT